MLNNSKHMVNFFSANNRFSANKAVHVATSGWYTRGEVMAVATRIDETAGGQTKESINA